MNRTIIAFLLCPFIIPILWTVEGLYHSYVLPRYVLSVSGVFWKAVKAIPLCWLLELCVAVPIYNFLKNRGLFKFPIVCCAGALIGILANSPYMIWYPHPLVWMVRGAFFGTAVALIFWMICKNEKKGLSHGLDKFKLKYSLVLFSAVIVVYPELRQKDPTTTNSGQFCWRDAQCWSWSSRFMKRMKGCPNDTSSDEPEPLKCENFRCETRFWTLVECL